MKFHVLIATTQGPVAVQGLRKIAAPQSMMCVNGTPETAPVSSGYHRFVARGSGLIAESFGGNAWRMDVSARIDTGDSWQLGVYLAHYLQQKTLLGDGRPNMAEGDKIIFVSGAVNVIEKSIMPVRGIPEKLKGIESCLSAMNWTQTVSHIKDNIFVLLPADLAGGETFKPGDMLLKHSAIRQSATLDDAMAVLQLDSRKTDVQWAATKVIVAGLAVSLLCGALWFDVIDIRLYSAQLAANTAAIDLTQGGMRASDKPLPEKKIEQLRHNTSLAQTSVGHPTIRLKLKISKHLDGGCDNAKWKIIDIPAKGVLPFNQSFNRNNRVCAFYLETMEYAQLFLIDPGSGSLDKMTLTADGWKLPVIDKRKLILMLKDKPDAQQVSRLAASLKRLADVSFISSRALAQHLRQWGYVGRTLMITPESY